MARRRSSRLTPAYDFDPRLGSTGRYTDRRTGRIVSRDTIASAMETQIAQSQAAIKTISTSLAEGDISIAEWQVSMAREMKTIHTQSAALSKGGWDQMTQSDWGAVGRLTREQYAFLENFAIDIESGKQRLRNLAGEVNGNFLRRADLYAQAGVSTHSQMERRQAIQNGRATHERRVLDRRAKHCACCPAEAARSWQLIGNNSLLPIGACDCATNCRCHFEFGLLQANKTIVRI
jgi:hypothetical protein